MSEHKQPWEKEPLSNIFYIGREQVFPGRQPKATFTHYSIPAWDEFSGPSIELGETIESNKTAISGPSVLVSKLNPRKPRVAVIEAPEKRACCSTEFICYQPQRVGENLRFWGAYLYSQEFSARLTRIAIGSTNSHTRASPRETLDWLVPSVPLAEQEVIAQIFDTLDTATRETEALIDKLKAAKQGLLHDLLTRGIDANGQLRPPQSEAPQLYKESRLGWIPREWDCETVSSSIEGTPRNGIYKPAGDIGAGVLLVGQTAFTPEGSVDFNLARRACTSAVECDAFGLKQDDLLVSRVFATREGVGQPVIVPELPEVAVYESNMMRLRVRQSVVLPHLLFLWLKHRTARAWVMSRAFASNQASINRETICSVPVPLPPMDEQTAILAVACAHDSRLDDEMRDLAKLQTLKTGLMDNLLTGRVRVTPLLESVQQAVAQTGA